MLPDYPRAASFNARIFSSVLSLTPTRLAIFSLERPLGKFPRGLPLFCLPLADDFSFSLKKSSIFAISSRVKDFLTVFSSLSASALARFDIQILITLVSISVLPSFTNASILRLPQISSFFSVITIGCSNPFFSILLHKGMTSPKSCLKRFPILISVRLDFHI